MAWTSPKTWTAGDVLTASELNQHVRDNLAYLKDEADGAAEELEDLSELATDGVLNKSAFPAGTVLQVVSTTKADLFSASIAVGALSSDVVTASITPSSDTSKILVFVNGSASGSEAIVFHLFRGDAAAVSPTDPGSRRSVYGSTTSAYDGDVGGAINISYLDSPNTTSPVTYALKVGHLRTDAASTVAVGGSAVTTNNGARFRGITTIVLMEVKV